MQYAEEEITPEMATAYLGHLALRQRKLRVHRVRQYARDIAAGKWILSTDPIVFDANGDLINGQHRLRAVVLAGKPAKFVVIRGAAPQVFEVLDEVLPRGAHDNAPEDWMRTKKMTAIARAMRDGFRADTLSPGDRATNRELVAFMQQHRKPILFAHDLFRANQAGTSTAQSVAAFARAYYHADVDLLRACAAALQDGFADDRRCSSMLLLRSFLTRAKSRGVGGRAWLTEVYQKTEKALALAIRGDTNPRQLKSTNDELFPLP
jgi:hypothetical protein